VITISVKRELMAAVGSLFVRREPSPQVIFQILEGAGLTPEKPTRDNDNVAVAIREKP
jgi:hypothetical protein